MLQLVHLNSQTTPPNRWAFRPRCVFPQKRRQATGGTIQDDTTTPEDLAIAARLREAEEG